MTLEVCIDSVESALAAQQGGAGRVELCADLENGGITPSFGMMKSVRETVSLKVHVMIRPRAGDFLYSDAEYDVMKNDVLEARKLGVDGLVFGILTKDRSVDSIRTEMLIQLARPLSVTFHRAFDETADIFHALEDLARIGVDRVLTSGGRPTVESGLQPLSELVKAAGSSLRVLAGGGITFENVAYVVRKTGVNEIHALSSVSTLLTGSSNDPKLFQHPRKIVDAQKVRRMVSVLQGLSPRK